MALFPCSRNRAASSANRTIPSSSTFNGDVLVIGDDLAWTCRRNLVVRRKTG